MILKNRLYILSAALIFSLWPVWVFAQNSSPTIAITSPASGTIVHPGDTIAFEISSTLSPSPTYVSIAGAYVAPATITGSPPYRGVISMNIDAPLGPMELEAISQIGSGKAGRIRSQPIVVDVRPIAELKAIRLFQGKQAFHFSYVSGVPTPIVVEGIFADGTTTHISQAASYTSNNTDVVRANPGGGLLETGPGHATVTVGYLGKSIDISVDIAQNARGDLNGDGVIDQDDLDMLKGILNTPALGKNDPRDLNHNGKIDALDARILTTLCTKPRCAK